MDTSSRLTLQLKIYSYALRAGRHICHQRPDRSFYRGIRKYPVCARCTGIYLTVPLGLLSAFFVELHWFTLIALALPLIIDGLTQLFTTYESTNRRRLITGALFGFAYGYFTLVCLTFFWRLIF